MARRRQADRTEATRAELISAGRALFAEQGYAATSSEALVERAGLTRGALYHHFDGKAGLFEAVVVSLHANTRAAIERAAADANTPWDAIKAGCRTFVLETNRPAMRRILLEDGLSVLGLRRWRDIDAAHGVTSLREGLRACERDDAEIEPLARLISGAVNEAAFWLAEAPTSRKRRAEVLAALDQMLEAIAAAPLAPVR